MIESTGAQYFAAVKISYKSAVWYTFYMKTHYKTSAAMREAVRRWQAANPNWQRRRKSGARAADIQTRLAYQGGRCAICRADSPGFKNRGWHLDHCHASGHGRGVLCGRCNIALGFMKDDPVRLRAAAEYIDHHARLQTLL